MKFLGILLVLAAAQLSFAADPATEIRAVIDAQVEAWNRGDIDAFMEGYERSDDTTFVSDRVLKGWDRVIERYRTKYGSREKMGTVRFSEIKIQMLGRDHASVLGRFAVTRGAAAGGNVSGRFTLVFKRTPAGWKIILDHTSAD